MLTDGLGDFELVLLGDFDEGVELAEMDAGLDGVLDGADPSFQLLLLGGAESLEVAANASCHF